VKKVGPLAPNMNPHAELFVQSIKRKCLEHFLVFSENHRRYLYAEFVALYNEERPHQARGNEPLGGLSLAAGLPATISLAAVYCQERLGGLVKHYSRVA
jgi:hypothetical protein